MRLLSLALLLLITNSSLAVEDTVRVNKVKCGKSNLKCTIRVSFKFDCTKVIKVSPKCTGQKKARCKKVPLSFITENGCKVTGELNGNVKKATMSNLEIQAPAAKWSDWREWSECDPSASCGKGMKFRHRNCNAPTADACDGDPVETAPCSSTMASCPSGSVDTTSLSALFFDFVFTNANETRSVPCCHSDH